MIFVENVKMFEGIAINIIDNNGEPLFEIYSTGMALGQVKVAKGIKYPRKDRIDENLKNAEITPVVHNGQLFITEEQLYDLMLEMKTEKVKPFRKWITSEVLPSIRKHGAYLTPDTIQKAMLDRARARRDKQTYTAHNLEEVEQIMNEHPGFIKAMWCGDEACELKMKEIRGTKSRCILEGHEHIDDKCVVCGKPAEHLVLWGIQY